MASIRITDGMDETSWHSNHVNGRGACAWRMPDRRFWNVLRFGADGLYESETVRAVMDDFGNLVRVP